MKKSKFISILTTLAVTGSMTLGALAFSGSAATTNPVGLALTCADTEFSLEEVESGKASAVVYVDVTTEFTADSNVTNIEFELAPSEWGVVDPVNFNFCDPNVVGTDKGNKMRHFNALGTSIISAWTETVPTTSDYMILNFNDEHENFVYNDTFPPRASIMTDSSLGKIRTGGSKAGEHFAQFDIQIPTDAEAGEYTINFQKAKCAIGIIDENGDNMEMVAITDLKPITFTISADGDDNINNDDFLLGDANLDGSVDVRDCAFIASALSKGKGGDLPKNADYNQDGKKDVRDAAALASALAKGTVKK